MPERKNPTSKVNAGGAGKSRRCIGPNFTKIISQKQRAAPPVHKPLPSVRLRGAAADLRAFAADYRPDPDDLRELAARLERLAAEIEGA